MMKKLIAIVICSLLFAVSLPTFAAEVNLGFTFVSLGAADLDTIQESLGYRVGVLVDAVAADSTAEKAGFKVGDVLFTIGKIGPDSAEMAQKALTSQTGTVECFGMRQIGEETQTFNLKLTLVANTNVDVPPVEVVPTKGIDGLFQHVSGLSFSYAKGWKVQPNDSGLTLNPPNIAMFNGAPAESYYLLTMPAAADITDATDQRVISSLDQLVAANISPALKRAQEPQVIKLANGQGVGMAWEVQGEKGILYVVSYVTIMNSTGFIIGGVGLKDKVTPRLPELKALFTSLKFGEGKHDQAVIGAWKLFSTRTLVNNDNVNFTTDDPRRASSVTDEQTTMQLRPDGIVVRTSISRTIAGGGAAGGDGKIWIDTGDQKEVKQGKWYAGDGTLFIVWDNGNMASYQYGLINNNGPCLALASGTRMDYWQGM